MIALARYKAEHGEYPEELESLVPRYLSAILAPVAGRNRWWYYPRQGSFELSFGYSPTALLDRYNQPYPVHYWSSDTESWHHDR